VDIMPVGAIFSTPVHIGPQGLLYKGIGFLSQGESGWGMVLTTHPHLEVKKEGSYSSVSP